MTDHPYRVRVALAVHLFDLIDYTVTAEQFAQAQPGMRVQVPWLRQTLVGLVVERVEPDQPLPDYRLKGILHLFAEVPLVDQSTLHLLQWAAQYYQAPVGEVILSSLPKLLRQGQPADILTVFWHPLTPTDDQTVPRENSKLGQAWAILRLHQHGTSEQILNMSGVTTAQLRALAKRGLADVSHVPADPTPRPMELAQMPLDANPEQASAIDQLRQALGQYRGFLLDGVTGSGKTEVYLQVMQTVLARGQQVLVLVPEIGLTPQSIQRFRARFSVDLAILHSGLNDRQRLQAWQQASSGKALIVLGTRLAVFTPLPRLGLIILDEEHDLSYKQQDHFRYHARDVALYRGAMRACPVILGSATPSLESLHLAECGKLQALHLPVRAGESHLPHFSVLDLKAEPRQHGLARRLITAMATQLEQGHQVLVFINRRGYAPVVMCTACGWQADCPHCDAHLTLHQQPIVLLHCHHCTYRQGLPLVCPSCQQDALKPVGQGTARIEETLQQLFPQYPLIRVDRDTTQRRDSWQDIYARAHEPGAAIFLGTQMLAKGHHFPYVTLVTILNVDSGLWSADFRAPERTAQMIIQVAGRAGRSQTRGQVLLQSLRPDHPLLQDLLQHGYAGFARLALTERREAGLPPYRYAALVRAESTQEDYNLHLLHTAQQQWAAFGPAEVDFWGPVNAPMARRAGFYRGHLLILCDSRALLHHQITAWWQWLIRQKRQHELRLTLDIDPQELS